MKRHGRLQWMFGGLCCGAMVFGSTIFGSVILGSLVCADSARGQEFEVAGPRRYGALDAGEEAYRIHEARRRALIGMQMGLNDAMNVPYTIPYGYGSGAWYLGLQEAWPAAPGAPIVARPNSLSASGPYRSVQVGPNRYIYRLPDTQSPARDELPVPPPERPAPSGPREF
jgi:hypothetical protein